MSRRTTLQLLVGTRRHTLADAFSTHGPALSAFIKPRTFKGCKKLPRGRDERSNSVRFVAPCSLISRHESTSCSRLSDQRTKAKHGVKEHADYARRSSPVTFARAPVAVSRNARRRPTKERRRVDFRNQVRWVPHAHARERGRVVPDFHSKRARLDCQGAALSRPGRKHETEAWLAGRRNRRAWRQWDYGFSSAPKRFPAGPHSLDRLLLL